MTFTDKLYKAIMPKFRITINLNIMPYLYEVRNENNYVLYSSTDRDDAEEVLDDYLRRLY